MMNKDDFRNRLMEAATVEEILDIFQKEEENYFEV
jgi:mannitol/fructose-specific phosphotransferase system IIA component (Ntr-type)